MICQKKNKKLLVFYLSFLLFCLAVIPCLLSVESYASETSTQTVNEYFSQHDFYDTVSYVCRKYASFPYLDYMTGANSGIVYDNFVDYLNSIDKSNLLNENVTITNNASGGRGYDIPQDVRQEMLNFVQSTYIEANPLSYVQAYIKSYTSLDSTNVQTFAQYNAMKTIFQQYASKGYWFFVWRSYSNPNYVYHIAVVPKVEQLFFYGSVNESGSFTSVTTGYNWNQNTTPWKSISGSHYYHVQVNGTASEDMSYNWGANSPTYNNTVPPYDTSKTTVFSDLNTQELVYVFNTINAFKAYNSNNSQPYYFPSNPQTTVPYFDGFTDSDLRSAGNFYNNIVINTEGQSPNNIRKTTDSVLGSLDGLFGGDDESSSGGLFDSLGDIITGATGAISPIKEIVLGDIKELVADVFDFLPPTIITLWVSGIIFGIFFGVLKLIRG